MGALGVGRQATYVVGRLGDIRESWDRHGEQRFCEAQRVWDEMRRGNNNGRPSCDALCRLELLLSWDSWQAPKLYSLLQGLAETAGTEVAGR
jgi:hypothetical protein